MDALELLGVALASGGDVRGAVRELRAAQKSLGPGKASQDIEKILGRMRVSAPDSLRAFLTADSVSHRTP